MTREFNFNLYFLFNLNEIAYKPPGYKFKKATILVSVYLKYNFKISS